MAKKQIEGGKKKVSRKKRATKTYKWIKHMSAQIKELSQMLADTEAQINEVKKRLGLVEWFLGGRESMEKVKKDND